MGKPLNQIFQYHDSLLNTCGKENGTDPLFQEGLRSRNHVGHKRHHVGLSQIVIRLPVLCNDRQLSFTLMSRDGLSTEPGVCFVLYSLE